MARTSVDVHATLNPPSPALTNPDLILPFDGILSLPLSPQRKQPPSPPDSDQTSSTWSHHGPQMNYSMPLRASPSRNGLGTPLSSIAELDTTPKRTVYPHATGETLRSSPTLKNSAMPRLKPSWEAKHERRWSNGSGSVHSDDIENMHWPDFEGPSEVDEESVVLEDEEEQLGDLPKIADSDDPAGDDHYLGAHVDTLEDDPLSRRADMILANAKKRLHAMEGNLRGARNSLLISAPSSPSSGYFSHINEKERPRYPTATGIYGHKARANNSPVVHAANFGHNRMLSDASSVHAIQTARALTIPKRASSALGSFARGLSSLEKSASLRGVRSQQDMRDSRLQNWIEESSMPTEAPRPVSQQADLPHSRSPSMETFNRPSSAASSLRFQMDELKGRINSLKARAHEDRVKRMSSTGSRTPSPFVVSEKHYEQDPNKLSLLSPDTSVGWSPNPSPRLLRIGTDFPAAQAKKANSSSDEDSRFSKSRSTVERTPPNYAESNYEDAEEALDNIKEESEESEAPSTPSTAVPPGEQKVLMGPQDPTAEELGYRQQAFENATIDDSGLGDEFERESSPDTASVGGQSEYFEAVPVLAERHEDREDAFDYENFFLHSAMGTYSRERRDSFSSESSVETTRAVSPNPHSMMLSSIVEASSPPTAVSYGYGTLVETSPGLHRRSHSVESMSTVASFQTAAEGDDEGSDSDGSQDPLDIVTQQYLSPAISSPIPPSPKRLVDSAVHMPLADAVANKPVHMEPHELAASLVSAMFGIETEGSKNIPAQDVALVEEVLTNLQKVVKKLQAQTDDYDRRAWRRRLDVAKRALEVDER